MSTVAGPSTSTLGGAAPSSDDDVLMVDSNGDAIAPDSAAAAADGDDAASDEPEDEYEIEYIISHSQETTTAGQLSYFVKWKGYPDSENSWVYESDMGGAQEMIQEYWAKVPGKKVKKMGTKDKKSGGGGKRQSSVSLSSPAVKSGAGAGGAGKRSSRRESTLTLGETSSRTTKRKNPDLAASRSPTPDDALIDTENDPALLRIRSDPTLTDEQRTLLEAQHLHAIQLDRLRKRYARIPDWDPIIKRVEAVEKMSDNKLRVFVHFESGDRLAFESVVAHHRCPLKLLQFYEENMRFKVRDEDKAVGERGPLRGEEEMRELAEFNAAHQPEGEAGEGQHEAANGVETQTSPAANGVEPEESTVDTEQQESTADTAPVEPLSAESVATTTAVVDENGLVEEQTEVVQS